MESYRPPCRGIMGAADGLSAGGVEVVLSMGGSGGAGGGDTAGAAAVDGGVGAVLSVGGVSTAGGAVATGGGVGGTARRWRGELGASCRRAVWRARVLSGAVAAGADDSGGVRAGVTVTFSSGDGGLLSGEFEAGGEGLWSSAMRDLSREKRAFRGMVHHNGAGRQGRPAIPAPTRPPIDSLPYPPRRPITENVAPTAHRPTQRTLL